MPASSAPEGFERRHALLYDQDCSLCTFQMQLLTWLDWRHALRLVPLSDSEVARIAPQLSVEALQEAIHCVTPEGRVYRGARALRFVGMRLPALWPVALFLWLPGVIGVAEKVYQVISRNRYVLSRLFGCGDACAVVPRKVRAGDTFASGAPESPKPGP
jgi:predicted DCC family thiol-disulfide oxidoreductase YuxK